MGVTYSARWPTLPEQSKDLEQSHRATREEQGLIISPSNSYSSESSLTPEVFHVAFQQNFGLRQRDRNGFEVINAVPLDPMSGLQNGEPSSLPVKSCDSPARSLN